MGSGMAEMQVGLSTTVESEVGRGSTFRVWLSRVAKAAA
jgi:signal transduction histidine kinase